MVSTITHPSVPIPKMPAAIGSPVGENRQTSAESIPNRVVLSAIEWETYEKIADAIGERHSIRLTYDNGDLEIMVISHSHGWHGKRFGRFIEVILEESNIPCETAGDMTFRKKERKRGFEPDDCFWIAHEAQMRGRADYDPARDPPPDLILEVEISRSALKRMAIFAVYKIPEVWRFDGETLHIHVLQPDDSYVEVERSPIVPKIPIGELTRFLRPDPPVDYFSTLRELRAWVREKLAKK